MCVSTQLCPTLHKACQASLFIEFPRQEYWHGLLFPTPGELADPRIEPWSLAFPAFSSVQLLSCVQLFATPWTAARQASLSFTNSWSLLKLISIELVMPSNHFILCHLLLLLSSVFPSIRAFPMNQFFASGGRSIGAQALASVLPMNIQD